MKVGFCTSVLKGGHSARGIGYYAKHLLEELKNLPDIEVVEFGLGEEIKDVALVHYPFFDLFQHSLPINKKTPTVVTIHDVTPLVFPNHYPAGIRGSMKNLIQKLALKSVDAVITDSEYSKKDIVKFLKLDSRKIYPVYLAPAGHFKVIKEEKVLSSLRKRYNLPEKFVLYVGSVNWNKNLLNITRACIDAGIDLFLIGKDFEKRENLEHPELRQFKEFLDKYYGSPLIHVLGFVEDEDLVGIINLASALLQVSYYEGFGLPILEAQACDTPVITSNVSSMPEVSGDGAYLVNPESVSEMTEAVKKVVTDKKLRGALIEKGRKNVKRFSWERTAEETLRVYEKVLSTR